MKKNFAKRLGSLLLTLIMVNAMAACGQQQHEDTQPSTAPTNAPTEEMNTPPTEEDPEPVTLKVAGMPDKDAYPEGYEAFIQQKATFEDMYPWITIEGTTDGYDVQTFFAKAAAGQLPDYITAPLTEISKILNAGYAMDLTEALKENGWLDMMNETVLQTVSKDGQVYCIPMWPYALGLGANYSVLEEAGVLNADGTVDWPETWEELGEMGGKIKAATGKAGISFPTTGNCGGWHFTSIAWSYGVDFVKQTEDGKWVANFANDECAAALQMISDWKWKYDALSDDLFLDYGGFTKLWYSAQAGFVLANPTESTLRDVVVNYGRDGKDLYFGTVPAGPAGTYELTGGQIAFMPSTSDPAKLDAFFKWVSFQGIGPDITEESLNNVEASLKSYVDSGVTVVAKPPLNTWVSGDGAAAQQALREKYADPDQSQYADYCDMTGVILHPEVEVYCQELYSILDGCVQEVLNNKDADIPALLEKAASDYQNNYLNNIE